MLTALAGLPAHGVDLLDLLLFAGVVVYAYAGYRQGLVVGVLSFAGFFGGGLLGARVARPIADALHAGGGAPALALVVVAALAVAGQALAGLLGGRVRSVLPRGPAGVDAVGGALASALSLLLVAWLLGTAVVRSPFPWLNDQVSGSAVLRTVDGVMPGEARALVTDLRTVLDRDRFTEVFGGLSAAPSRQVAPPDEATVTTSAVAAARSSVAKVSGVATACSRQIEGSGFVYASGRVMTNAHVVAGVRRPVVQVGGRSYPASVVLFDDRRDVAVLAVEGLPQAPLRFSTVAAAVGSSAVVAGYPENGPYDLQAARIRYHGPVRGPDVYGTEDVTREMYSVRSTVRPGNSGGPLLAPDGTVLGVMFAAATDDGEQTGFALTAQEVGSDAAAGLRATAPVGTGGCD